MSEFEAIEILRKWLTEHGHMPGIKYLAIAIKTAIQALKEQQQREQGCEYCKDSKPLYEGKERSNIEEVYIEQDGSISFRYWFGEDGIGDNFSIDCCPKCGRRLSHE